MRLLVLAALLLPLLSQAQEYERGSYVLIGLRPVRQEGYLRLNDGWQLAVKSYDGQKLQLSPSQVSSLRIGNRRYTTAGNFKVRGTGSYVANAFVEQLDSGRVELLRYAYQQGRPTAGTIPNGGATHEVAYLLRTDGLPPAVVQGTGKKFREALRPFLAYRPDLQQLLNEEHLALRDVPAAIRALNHGQPFVPGTDDELE